MYHTIQTIEELSTSEIILLTQLLSFSSTPSWLHEQVSVIRTFPSSLLRPSSRLARLALHLPFHPPKALLCPSHKPLNPLLIRRIFLQTTSECTTRIFRLKKRQDISPAVSTFIQRMGELNALWMSSQVYRSFIDQKTARKEDQRFQRIESGCEACILAVIGGDIQALIDLRASCLGRMRNRLVQPRILPLLEGWIDQSGEGEGIRDVSDELGREVKVVKRKIKQERRECKSNVKRTATKTKTTVPVPAPAPALVPVPAPKPIVEDFDKHENDMRDSEDDGGVEADFEGSIISFYRDIMSTANLLDHNDRRSSCIPEESDIHPAFRGSIFCLYKARAFQRHASTFNEPALYGHIAYSGDSEFGDWPEAEHRSSLERHSKTYRDLVGSLEDSSSGSVIYEPTNNEIEDVMKVLMEFECKPRNKRRSSWTSSFYSHE